MAESPWLAAVREAIGQRRDIMAWRQHAGTYCPPNKPKTRIKVAPDGIADIMGTQLCRVAGPNIAVIETVNPESMQPLERQREWFYGKSFAIETKSLTGAQRESQINFEHAFRAGGGTYILAPEGRWDVIWYALGEEPDPVCAEKAQEIWDAIQRERDAEADRKKEKRS